MELTATEVKVYAVYTNTDRTEGRGSEYVLFFCYSLTTAKRLAKRNYVMGTDCPVREVTGYKIDGRLYLNGAWIELPSDEDRHQDHILAEKEKARIAKKNALVRAKELGLSDEEIKALSAEI